MRCKFKRIVAAILCAVTFFCLIKVTSTLSDGNFQLQYDVSAASAKTPTDPPIKIIGIWLTSGYDLQPDTDNYTTVNNPITLYTNAGRSIFSTLLSLTASPHYQWYSSTDGLIYSKVSSSNGGTDKNLTINPSTIGTKYYQLWTDWYTLVSWGLFDTTAYTNVINVHTLSDPINAKSMTVSSGSNYLYNNLTSSLSGLFTYPTADTTSMHTNTIPNNATGTVKWYSSDSSIASVDENTGVVSSNTDGKDGTVTIRGVYTNPDGTTLSDSTKIKVGGGLDDETTSVGDKATFTLQGSYSSAGNVSTSIEWHRVSADGKSDTVVSKGSSLSYTTAATTLSDDGTYYYAKVKVSQSDSTGKISTQTGQTNKAKLNVLTKGDPDISQKIELADTQTGADSDSVLNNVMTGDQLVLSDTLTNKSSTGTLANGKLVIPIRKGSTLQTVALDNTILMLKGTMINNSVNITQDYNSNKGYDEVILSSPTNSGSGSALNFDLNQKHTVEIFYKIAKVDTKETLTTAPTISGTNSDSENYSSNGPFTTINFATGGISLDPSDISFGSHLQQPGAKLFDRTKATNSPNNVLTVDDSRRGIDGKSQIQISSTPLYKKDTDNTNQVLDSDLRYYDPDGTYSSLADGSVVIESTASGSPLSSITWIPTAGLRLYLPNEPTSGSYTGTITWSAITSV
ncbi:Ig-like domain-containing protein [Companilactobacillus allii]|uniref:BIG2 domain-containing protein n=1 Tax=Companilactobacillus allii TaxID=1847728 RepID=A0A1P8Q225_9LACO|nr:Ig-like domain-containing protein [Companilactobacillus allii]APX71886.1 hypothetical protein BTM29_04650 [Companilactobacillus allii]USQ68979.1 Ig-like domain-containing protein [Companilactobacillus allii]